MHCSHYAVAGPLALLKSLQAVLSFLALNALTLVGSVISFIVRSSGRQFYLNYFVLFPRFNCSIFLVIFKISLAHIQLVLF
jgi:hypothetical protein